MDLSAGSQNTEESRPLGGSRRTEKMQSEYFCDYLEHPEPHHLGLMRATCPDPHLARRSDELTGLRRAIIISLGTSGSIRPVVSQDGSIQLLQTDG